MLYSLDGVWSNFENTKQRMETVHHIMMSRQGHIKHVQITEKLSHVVLFSLNINVKN